MPPKANLNVNSGPENSSKLKVTGGSVTFLCSWIKVLGIWHPIDPKKFHDELQNGLLLCRITEMLVAGASFPTNKKPLTKSPCIKNLEMALPTIWKKNPSPINMCTAQEFYDKKALAVTRCMLEIFKTLQVAKTRAEAPSFLGDLQAGLAPIGRPLSESTLENPQSSSDLVSDFSDCTRLVAILVMRHKLKPEAVLEFWGHPTTKFQKMQNATALVKALDAARAGGLFTANDWISPPEPNPDSLLYVIAYTHQRLRLSRDCWEKEKSDLSDIKFKDGVPLANPPVLSKPDEDDVGGQSMKLGGDAEQKKAPKKEILSSPVKSSISQRKTNFVRTAASLDNSRGGRCIMSPTINYSEALAKEKSPKGQSLIRVASAPAFKDPHGGLAPKQEQAEPQPTYAQLKERGVRSASTGRPGSALASTAPAGGRYGARTPPPAPRPASGLQNWQPRKQDDVRPAPQQRLGGRLGGEVEKRGPEVPQFQSKLLQQQQGTLRNQNRAEPSPARRAPGGREAWQSNSPTSARDPRTARNRVGSGTDDNQGDTAADQFLTGISAAIQRIDPYSLGKNWPRHWERDQPRARSFEPLFDEKDGSWQGASVDPRNSGYPSNVGVKRGGGGDFDGFGQASAKATPTTRIKAHVVNQDGSTWPARIYTNVVDIPATDAKEDSVKMVIDFESCEAATSDLRIRIDASFIADIKITQSKGGGGDDHPAGTSYFLLAQKGGVIIANNDSGVQYMPMPENLAVVHVTVSAMNQDAENFFGELLILAQFLNATR